ncbi:hypothetical protein [Rickettsiales endosymbiont of Stachyamoeba lipophora]|uniref:hypothetical protein n=1 Tax=Rickettsiales endosymbiont of Stachyamoeba lipophora TaxID=2486578 RepID=UPI000F64FDC6|nr:hypothetical protein [Rickettsiales endosymbiont of Stachyamoeba lipophora]AZL16294.1 hypothetical protein EF513_07125 [Rickettsiales endosymbiont of Stachyamoeba lipophora]
MLNKNNLRNYSLEEIQNHNLTMIEFFNHLGIEFTLDTTIIRKNLLKKITNVHHPDRRYQDDSSTKEKLHAFLSLMNGFEQELCELLKSDMTDVDLQAFFEAVDDCFAEELMQLLIAEFDKLTTEPDINFLDLKAYINLAPLRSKITASINKYQNIINKQFNEEFTTADLKNLFEALGSSNTGSGLNTATHPLIALLCNITLYNYDGSECAFELKNKSLFLDNLKNAILTNFSADNLNKMAELLTMLNTKSTNKNRFTELELKTFYSAIFNSASQQIINKENPTKLDFRLLYKILDFNIKLRLNRNSYRINVYNTYCDRVGGDDYNIIEFTRKEKHTLVKNMVDQIKEKIIAGNNVSNNDFQKLNRIFVSMYYEIPYYEENIDIPSIMAEITQKSPGNVLKDHFNTINELLIEHKGYNRFNNSVRYNFIQPYTKNILNLKPFLLSIGGYIISTAIGFALASRKSSIALIAACGAMLTNIIFSNVYSKEIGYDYYGDHLGETKDNRVPTMHKVLDTILPYNPLTNRGLWVKRVFKDDRDINHRDINLIR